MPKTLYICYFGLREPLVQTQVLPYLRELVAGGIEVALLTFEPERSVKWTADELEDQRLKLRADGIKWHSLPYHKWPSVPATLYDLMRAVVFVRNYVARERPDVLHGRVHLPTLMAALARKASRHKPKLLFDIRGFFPEEYTDAGIWPENGWLYRGAKRVERWLMKESDGFVVLTEKARSILFPESRETGLDKQGRPVEVIPCCVDLDRFRASPAEVSAIRSRLGIEGRRVIVYVGSFGGWYLGGDMMELFSVAKASDPTTFLLLLTQRDKDNVIADLLTRGFTQEDFFVDSVPPDEVPGYLGSADIAVSFIKACYSKQSSSPTKIAEYLACGLPVICNRGVGDVDSLIDENGVGVLVDGLTTEAFATALEKLTTREDIRERCSETAKREFDLKSVGGVRYRRIYKSLLGNIR